MGLWEIMVIAVSLSMDAFAISITYGLSIKNPKITEIFIPGLYFGFFQALMPLAGFFAGTYFAKSIQFLDHWVAFALLGFIGGKMIKDSFSQDKEEPDKAQFQHTKMLLLAIATSIDALAAGITFAFFEINIFTAILIIGLTTFCISTVGVKVGNIFGGRFKSKAEFAGGAVLIILGLKILIEHLFLT
ncbi:MAG: manganese efflux pump MntP family protein [Spirochaetaceae bacterium]|nr:manganese efflux pump MntP family protein [Spirochaetaceae bacterium]